MKISEDQNTITLDDDTQLKAKNGDYDSCEGCFFINHPFDAGCFKAKCQWDERKDEQDVIYVEVKNETK